MWCFVGVKFGDSLQETTVSIRLEFEEGKPFLQLLHMENCEKTEKNFNEKLFQGNSILIIVKVVTKYKSLYDVVSCTMSFLYFHIIEFLFKNEDKIINFCSLNRLNCKQILINKFWQIVSTTVISMYYIISKYCMFFG